MEKSRIKTLINKNAFIRFLSVFIAIILWSYVSFVINPETQKEITDIPVKFINEQVLLNSGLTLVKDDYFVDVQIKGRRNILSSINNKRVWAEVDLAGYSKLGKNRANVKICGLPSSVEIIREPENIFLELDKTYSVQKNININITGEPQKGFAVHNSTVKPSRCTIEGSKKLINSIQDVTVIVDVSNLNNTFTTKQKINIIGEDGNEIKGLKSSVEIVNVKVPIVKVKEVDLKTNLEGNPKENIFVDEVKVNPKKVLITGKNELLEKTEQLNIKSIDISGASEDIYANKQIMFPEGISLVNANKNVNVKVSLKKLIKRSFWIPKQNIEFKNKNEELKYKITTDNVHVVFEGFKKELNKLDQQTVSADVNVENLNNGVYLLPLNVNLPQNINLKQEPKVKVKVS